MNDSKQRIGEDGHYVYTCANCNTETNVVFYIGTEDDDPRWACSICVTRQKPR